MNMRIFTRAVAALAVVLCAGAYAGEAKGDKGDKRDDKVDVKVFVTKTGTKYHVEGCKFVDKDSKEIALADTKGKYEPCAVCKPDATVYVTKTGAKFHMKTCTHAGKDPLSMMLAEAKARKLEPCKTCNPPDGK